MDESDYSQQTDHTKDTECVQAVPQLKRSRSRGPTGASVRPGPQAIGYFDLKAHRRKVSEFKFNKAEKNISR